MLIQECKNRYERLNDNSHYHNKKRILRYFTNKDLLRHDLLVISSSK